MKVSNSEVSDPAEASEPANTSRAFASFAQAELPRLLRYAVMLTGDRELAQDLVQDVMVKAHRHWRRIAAAEHPDRYVTTMLTHAHLSWRRRWSVRHVLLSDTAVDGPPAPDPSTNLADREDVWQRLATLPNRQRAVLVLRYYERLSDAEIAEVLGCSAGTVRGYASRALATLRLDRAAELTDSRQIPVPTANPTPTPTTPTCPLEIR